MPSLPTMIFGKIPPNETATPTRTQVAWAEQLDGWSRRRGEACVASQKLDAPLDSPLHHGTPASAYAQTEAAPMTDELACATARGSGLLRRLLRDNGSVAAVDHCRVVGLSQERWDANHQARCRWQGFPHTARARLHHLHRYHHHGPEGEAGVLDIADEQARPVPACEDLKQSRGGYSLLKWASPLNFRIQRAIAGERRLLHQTLAVESVSLLRDCCYLCYAWHLPLPGSPRAPCQVLASEALLAHSCSGSATSAVRAVAAGPRTACRTSHRTQHRFACDS